jgi:hypothetical protein
MKSANDECMDSNEWRKVFITSTPTNAASIYGEKRSCPKILTTIKKKKKNQNIPPSISCCMYQLSGI